MTKTDDSGFAFPRQHLTDNDTCRGLTKREWFAGQALAGLCSGTYRYTSTAEEIARLSYFLADAMISEGNKDGTE